MQRYDSYKDSRVKWLGEIPSHWEVKRWRFLMDENTKKNLDCKVRLQLQFRYGDIVRKANQSEESDVLDTISKYTIVEPNDIMINGLNLNYDFISQRVAQVNEEGVITSAYISLRPAQIANSRYYTYFLKSMDAKKMFHGMGTGIRLTLSYNELKNQFIPMPSLKEQEAIANYLDSATSKIDEAIAQQQKMIDLLNERKQIIINQVVTKGLNPNVPMRDSGVDWIGEIPTHWKILRNKYLFKESDERNISLKYSLLSFSKIKGIVPQYEISDRGTSSEDLSKYKVLHVGQLLENRLQAWNGMFGTSAIEGCVSPDYSVFNVKESIINVEYVSFLFRTPLYVMQWSNASKGIGTGFNRLYTPQFNSILCVCPPLNEQVEIVKYVKSKTNKLILAINKIQKTISLLQERKQIIINDVVTGKIKVI